MVSKDVFRQNGSFLNHMNLNEGMFQDWGSRIDLLHQWGFTIASPGGPHLIVVGRPQLCANLWLGNYSDFWKVCLVLSMVK